MGKNVFKGYMAIYTFFCFLKKIFEITIIPVFKCSLSNMQVVSEILMSRKTLVIQMSS